MEFPALEVGVGEAENPFLAAFPRSQTRRTPTVYNRTIDRERPDLEKAEKHVADEIEAAIDVPSSIEAEAMLEAAEIQELEAGES